MAIWKLSLPLFSAKSSGLRSISQLHFIAATRLRTHQYALVCESQESPNRCGRRTLVDLRRGIAKPRVQSVRARAVSNCHQR